MPCTAKSISQFQFLEKVDPIENLVLSLDAIHHLIIPAWKRGVQALQLVDPQRKYIVADNMFRSAFYNWQRGVNRPYRRIVPNHEIWPREPGVKKLIDMDIIEG